MEWYWYYYNLSLLLLVLWSSSHKNQLQLQPPSPDDTCEAIYPNPVSKTAVKRSLSLNLQSLQECNINGYSLSSLLYTSSVTEPITTMRASERKNVRATDSKKMRAADTLKIHQAQVHYNLFMNHHAAFPPLAHVRLYRLSHSAPALACSSQRDA